MTTYEDNMTAVEQIPLPELYEIRKGWTNSYYTSYPTSLYFRGHDFIPASIRRGDWAVDTNLNTVSVNISSAVLPEFGAAVANTPAQRTRIMIYRAVSDDLSEYVTLFDGWVTGIVFSEEDVATVKVDQRASILDREIDMVLHQAPCNHHVFDSGCKLDYALYVVSSSIVVSGSELFSNDFDIYDDGYFTGGEVHYQDDARLITNHVGSTITLHIPFDARVATGTVVDVYPGCDGRAVTCDTKYNNLSNMRAFPYIPNKNPAIWGV